MPRWPGPHAGSAPVLVMASPGQRRAGQHCWWRRRRRSPMGCRVTNPPFGRMQNLVQHARRGPRWEDAAMREDADTAQAWELLHCLDRQVEEISQKLEAAEAKR